MITDTDQDILITTQHDTIQEAELIRAAKNLMSCYDAYWDDHLHGDQVKLYFSLASVRYPTRRDQEYCHLSVDLYSYELQKGAQYDLLDFDKALKLLHDKLKKILEVVEHNYSKHCYLKFTNVVETKDLEFFRM